MLNKQRSLQKGRFNAPLHCIGGISYKLGNSLVRAYCEICGTHGSSALLLLYLLNRGQEGFKLNAPLVWSKHQQLQVLFPLFSLILYCFNWTESSQQSGTNHSSSGRIQDLTDGTKHSPFPRCLHHQATIQRVKRRESKKGCSRKNARLEGWRTGDGSLCRQLSAGHCPTSPRAPVTAALSLLGRHRVQLTLPAELFYKLEDKSQIQK